MWDPWPESGFAGAIYLGFMQLEMGAGESTSTMAYSYGSNLVLAVVWELSQSFFGLSSWQGGWVQEQVVFQEERK